MDGSLGQRVGVLPTLRPREDVAISNNSPVADFLCGACNEEFELKSQKGKFGAKVADGAYKTKCERLAASNNPNLLLMNYDLKSLAVVNLLIVPKHFFVREIIEERKPLAQTARRAGWIGSNIMLSAFRVPGKFTLCRTASFARRSRPRRLAKDTLSQERVAGDPGLATRRDEMREVDRQT